MLLRRATTQARQLRRLSTATKREYDLVLFGATGYSGRMCADYLLRTHKAVSYTHLTLPTICSV